MKKYKCIGILSFALVATISGCTLEAAKEVGDTCKDTAYVWFGGTNQIFEKGTDSEYEIYLNAGVCPIQAPHCMKMLAYDDYDADCLSRSSLLQ